MVALRDRARQAARIFSVGWPSMLGIVLILVGGATGAGLEPLVLLGLVVVQVVWLTLWYGAPLLARATGRALGRRAD